MDEQNSSLEFFVVFKSNLGSMLPSVVKKSEKLQIHAFPNLSIFLNFFPFFRFFAQNLMVFGAASGRGYKLPLNLLAPN